jgi:hypothetical protein
MTREQDIEMLKTQFRREMLIPLRNAYNEYITALAGENFALRKTIKEIRETADYKGESDDFIKAKKHLADTIEAFELTEAGKTFKP